MRESAQIWLEIKKTSEEEKIMKTTFNPFYELSGLKSETEYEIKVCVRSISYGASAYSAPIFVTTN